MSYDIYLQYETPDGPVRADFSWNYTSNCVRMWRAAGAPLGDWHGKLAKDCVEPLYQAITNLVIHKNEYDAMNPDNGWGSRVTLVPDLVKLAEGFEQYPNAQIYVSK